MKALDRYNYEKVNGYFNRGHQLDVEALKTITRELKGETLYPTWYPTLFLYDIEGRPNRVEIQSYYFSALGEILAYDIDGNCHTIDDCDEFLNYNLFEVFMEIEKGK